MATDGTHDHLLGYVVASTGEQATASSPFPDVVLHAVPLSSPTDVAAAVRQVADAQSQWQTASLRRRRRILRAVHRILLTDNQRIVDVIQQETGKARGHALDEVMHAAVHAAFLARGLRRALQPRRRPGLFPLLTRVRVHRVPKGVVGVITPWNYPFTLTMSDALAALAAGNGVVIKPDVQTVWSALHAVDVMCRAGVPSALVRVVVGDGPTIGGALIDSVDHVCFTGSTGTGRLVAQRAAGRLIDCSLELGGKNPMIVCADANLDQAVDIAVHACFTAAGQLCVSTERIYVHQDRHDEFVRRLVERVERLTVGAKVGWGYEVGSLATAAAKERVMAAISGAVAEGADIAVGGTARPDLGPWVVMPTVLTGVTPDFQIATSEVFGPVVYVTAVRDIDEAVQLANDSPYGLSASVITRDFRAGRAIASQLACGSVNVNDGFAASFGSVAAPMGGMRESGIGRRHGIEGIQRFTQPQTVAVQWLLRATPQWGVSPATWGTGMARMLRVMRAVRLR